MPRPIPESALALWLLAQAQRHGTVLAVLHSAPRLPRVVALADAMASGVDALSLPPWAVLRYDRRAVLRRSRWVSTLLTLIQPPARPRLLLTSAAAALIRVRPPGSWSGATIVLSPGDTIDLDAFRFGLADRGYHCDEHVDGPGEVALRGHAIDLFLADDKRPRSPAVGRPLPIVPMQPAAALPC